MACTETPLLFFTVLHVPSWRVRRHIYCSLLYFMYLHGVYGDTFTVLYCTSCTFMACTETPLLFFTVLHVFLSPFCRTLIDLSSCSENCVYSFLLWFWLKSFFIFKCKCAMNMTWRLNLSLRKRLYCYLLVNYCLRCFIATCLIRMLSGPDILALDEERCQVLTQGRVRDMHVCVTPPLPVSSLSLRQHLVSISRRECLVSLVLSLSLSL
jgi:hypothetical protein